MGEVVSQTANSKSPTLDPSIVDELKQWPPCRPLNDVPSRYEVEEAIRALANRKAVGPDGLPAELLQVLADEGEFNTLGKFHISSSLCGREVACRNNGKMQRLKCFTRTKIGQIVATELSQYLTRGPRRQSTPQSHRGSLE